MSTRRWCSLQVIAATLCGVTPLLLSASHPLRSVPSLAGGIDPLLQSGILQWVLRHPPINITAWNAPFFWPSEFSLAFMDTLFGQALLIYPLPFARDWPALAYNLCLMLTLALCFLATVRLARELELSRGAALLAATVFVLGPQAAGHFHHLNQLPAPFLPLALWGALRVSRGRPTGILWIAVAVFLQPLWGFYNLAVLWVALLCTLPFLLPGLGNRWGLALTLVYALGLLWGVAAGAPYREAADLLAGYVRGPEMVGPYAGRPFDLLHPPSVSLLAWPASIPGRPVLYAGILWPLVALVGFVAALRGDKRPLAREMWWGLALAGVVGLLLSFGRRMPLPLLGEVDLPLGYLQDRFWALQSLRAPTRLFLPAALVMALAGAFCLDLLRGCKSRSLALLGVALIGLALLDLAPGRFGAVRVQPDGEEQELMVQLEASASEGAWIAFPTPCDERQERELDARCMLWAAMTERPVAGGSSGFVPMPVRRIRRACCRGLGEVCADDLRREGVSHLLLDPGQEQPWLGELQWEGTRWRLWRLP